MNIERFQQIIEAYGSVPERWPFEERGQAMALLARSSQATALLEDALKLDQLLDQSAPVVINQGLVTQILAHAARTMESRPVSESEKQPVTPKLTRIGQYFETFLAGVDSIDWSWKSVMQPAAILGSVALLGLTTGIFAPEIIEQAVYGADIEEGFWQVAFDDSGFDLEGLASIGEVE